MGIGNWLARVGQSSDQYVQLPQEMMHQLESRLMLSAAPVFAPALGAAADTWTVMVYMDGDNNLEGAGIGDVNQMETVGSTPAVNVLVQFDRTNGYDSTNGNWTDTRRGRVVKDSDPDLLATAFTSIGEKNMGDPQTLTDFINWSTASYPAEHYMLVLWDHGGGTSGVCWDDTDGDDNLSVPEVGDAIIDAGVPMDIVGFDACLMAMMEQAYEIRDWSDYLVASEETIPYEGWAYDTVLTDLVANPAQPPQTLASDVVTRYAESYDGQWTLSAIDLNALSAPTGLAASVDQFASVVLSSATGSDYSAMQAIWQSDSYFTEWEFRDLGNFLTGVAGSGALTASISAAAQAALTAYNTAVVTNHSGPGMNATGLSIYFQQPDSPLAATYSDAGMAFTADTQWDEFLEWWGTGPPPSSIIGHVWSDMDQDGVRDAAEPSLPRQRVYLDLNRNGQLEAPVTAKKTSVDVPMSVPDLTMVSSSLDVSGLDGVVVDVNVTLSILHSYDADVSVVLVSPSGRRVSLFSRVGGSGMNFTNTVLDDQASRSITAGKAPFTGSYRPQSPLASLNGEDPNGQWRLEVSDLAWFDEGMLTGWSLTLTTGEPTALTDLDGRYAFVGLKSGDYEVRQASGGGWMCSFPAAPNAGFYAISLAPGQILQNADFGILDVRPVAQAQGVSIFTDVPGGTDITLVGTDESTASNNLTYQITVQPQHGRVTVVGNVATYTPNADWVGTDKTDRFSFTVTDTGNPNGSNTNVGVSDPAVVTVVMNPMNTAPVVSPLSAVIDEDSLVTLTLLGDDVETPNTDLVYVVSRAPQHGTVTIVGNQATYTPDADYQGDDSFEYTATDNGDPVGSHLNPGDLTSAPAVVSLTVTPKNDVPNAVPQGISINEDESITITLVGADVETAAGSLIYRITTPPSHGTLVLTGRQAIYTPDQNYNGSDDFKFTVTDNGDPAGSHQNPGAATSAPAVVSITVNAVNDQPIAKDRIAVTNQDAAMTIVLGVSDVETPADLLTYAITQPLHGSAVLSMVDGVAQVLYTPVGGYSGTDSFTFTVADTGDPAGNNASALTSQPGTVSIGVARREVLTSGSKTTLIDGNNMITLSLTGAGSGVFYSLAPFDCADPRTITDMILENTDEKTSLVITNKSITGIGNITVTDGAMGSIVAKTTNLLGDIEILNGGVSVIQMNDVSGGRHIHVGASALAAKNGLSASFSRIGDLSVFSATPIKSLTALEWLDSDGTADVIEAPWLGALRLAGNKRANIAGNFESDLTLTGAGSPVLTAGKIDVAGALKNSTWDITGDVGAVSVVGDVDQWALQLHSNIKSIKLGKVIDGDVAVENQIGSLQALCWLDGYVSADSLKALKITGDRKTGLPGDLNARLALDGDPAGGLSLGSADIAGILNADLTVHGSAGAVRVGALRAELAIDGNVKSVAVNEPLAITPEDGGSIGSLRVGGTAGVKSSSESFQFSNSTLYSRQNNLYDLEDLRGYDVLSNWWKYNTAYNGTGGPGWSTANVEVDQNLGGNNNAYMVTMPVGEGDTAVRTGWYSDADGIHLDLWQANWETGNQVTINFIKPPVASLAQMRPGQRVTGSAQFSGEWTMPYMGMAISGISSGTGRVETQRLGHEQVTVSAGTFVAVKFQTSMNVTGRAEFWYKDTFYAGSFSAVETQTWWSVAGVGIVKGDLSTSVRIAARGLNFSWEASSSREMIAHA